MVCFAEGNIVLREREILGGVILAGGRELKGCFGEYQLF